MQTESETDNGPGVCAAHRLQGRVTVLRQAGGRWSAVAMAGLVGVGLSLFAVSTRAAQPTGEGQAVPTGGGAAVAAMVAPESAHGRVRGGVRGGGPADDLAPLADIARHADTAAGVPDNPGNRGVAMFGSAQMTYASASIALALMQR